MVRREVKIGEEVEMRLDVVNVSRKPTLLVRVENMVPNDFEVVDLPSSCSLTNGSVDIKEKSVGPFQVETIKLKLKAMKAGCYTLNPEVTYVDDLGKTKTVKLNPITVTVQPIKPEYEELPGRITTGYAELDKLLLGGIPENQAVLLVAPSSDERQLLVKRFLAIGVRTGETTLYITSEPGNAQDLARQNQNLFLVECGPQTDQPQQPSSNAYRLRGIDNLTNIDIALTKYFRTLEPKQTAPRRACIDILSDVLLEHHAVVTRKWLSSLLANLKTKSFTTLAVINPRMHPQEECEAILGIFEGAIRVTDKETPEGTKQTLKIKKLINQKYSDKELSLDKETLKD